MKEDKTTIKAAAAVAAQKHVSGATAPQYVLTELRYWDVVMSPTKRYMLAGRMVPSLKNAAIGLFMKKRRITVEIYRPNINTAVAENNNTRTRKMFGELLKGISSSSLMEVADIGDNDLIAFRILKPKKRKAGAQEDEDSSHNEGDWDSHSISSMSFTSTGRDSDDDLDVEDSHTRWKERYRFRLDTVQVVAQTSAKGCDLQMGSASGVVVKTINFESSAEMQTFLKVLNQMRQLQAKRSARLARGYRESIAQSTFSTKKKEGGVVFWNKGSESPSKKIVETSDDSAPSSPEGLRDPNLSLSIGSDLETGTISSDDRVRILVEIVSATNLPIADIVSSDPYVKVLDSKVEVHRTKVLAKTLNPVWTLSTGSLFLLDQSVDEFFASSNFVTFQIKDYDSFGKNEDIGSVEISKEKLVKGTGERLEFEINPPGKHQLNRRAKEGSSRLALRFRPATMEDVKFMRSFQENKRYRRTAVYAGDTFLPPRDHKISMMQKQERKVGHNHFVEYRVKPFADPDNQMETSFLTRKEIHMTALQQSRHWIEAGTGGLAKAYVEIIGCDKLPNLDTSITGRDKTDAFVCLVFEDCVVNTDVINDCLSPRWMPWTQRAFVLNVMHPSSQLMVGVFDHDRGIADASHDPVGRAVVNLTNLRPGTVYTTNYTLYEISNDTRVNRGTITLRIQVEIPDNRKMLLGSWSTSLQNDVSVSERQYFRTTHHTLVHGEHPSVLSLRSISSYVQEILTYLDALFFVQSGLATVLLWRGHFPINVRYLWPNCGSGGSGCIDKCTRVSTWKLPLHSMVSFGWGVALANNFDRFPAFLVFSIAWFLLATMEVSRSHPSKHDQPKSYLELLSMFLFNSSVSPVEIESNENLDAIKAYNEERAKQKKAREDVLNTIQMEQRKYEAYINSESSKLEEEVDIMTQAQGGLTSMALAPFRGILLPIQHLLNNICVVLRVVKSVVIWRDSFAAFWIVSLSLIGSLLILFIPWTFLISWTFKIAVWVLLGPWMKLLDICYFRRSTLMEEEQQKADLAEKFQERYTMLLDESFGRKLRKEAALKMKDFKKYMFGEFLMRVPVLKEERYYDDPLPSSYATRGDPTATKNVNIVERKYGQLLRGDMIPEREIRLTQFVDKSPQVTTPSMEEKRREGLLRPRGRGLRFAFGGKIEESEPLLQPTLGDAYGSVEQKTSEELSA
eukprot:Nitzschia sp. Nitz4//scaffold248_size28759//12858//16752//NITZ4_008109-RA/size28759-snap-gene-0.10-mRNA-1//-1//CDS//3329543992//987//frame0